MTLVLCALAAAYTTYVVTRSSFPPVERLRVAVFTRFGEGSWPAYLATCAWCAGFYLAGLVVALTWSVLDDLELPVLYWLASATVAGLTIEVADALARSGTQRGQ